ncbi:MAG: iron-sulfur cluster assembly scaffold protein [Chlamydiota bacterium]
MKNSSRFIPLPVPSRYSRKLASRIENPRNIGVFNEEDAERHEMRLAIGIQGTLTLGAQIKLYLLVDENDGIIADAKFQVFGPAALIGAADAACDLLLRKSYVQSMRITADLIDKHLRDKTDDPAFPEEVSSLLNLVLEAIENAVETCTDIPYHDVYVAPPVHSEGGEATLYPGWDELPLKTQVIVLEEVIAQDIRPYVELDAGGVEVVDILQNREVIIAYQGSCTSCYSATGATLSAIQQILRTKVHPDLQVTPDMKSLNL